MVHSSDIKIGKKCKTNPHELLGEREIKPWTRNQPGGLGGGKAPPVKVCRPSAGAPSPPRHLTLCWSLHSLCFEEPVPLYPRHAPTVRARHTSPRAFLGRRKWPPAFPSWPCSASVAHPCSNPMYTPPGTSHAASIANQPCRPRQKSYCKWGKRATLGKLMNMTCGPHRQWG